MFCQFREETQFDKSTYQSTGSTIDTTPSPLIITEMTDPTSSIYSSSTRAITSTTTSITSATDDGVYTSESYSSTTTEQITTTIVTNNIEEHWMLELLSTRALPYSWRYGIWLFLQIFTNYSSTNGSRQSINQDTNPKVSDEVSPCETELSSLNVTPSHQDKHNAKQHVNKSNQNDSLIDEQ